MTDRTANGRFDATDERRKAILRKLAGLQAKTQAAGATEAEALAAAELASKLMRDWHIEEAELFAGANTTPAWDIGDEIIPSSKYEAIKLVTRYATKLCGVRLITRLNGDYHLFGDRPDREAFKYLIGLVGFAFEAEWLRYSLFDMDFASLRISTKRGSRDCETQAAFTEAMARRIGERLAEMVVAEQVYVDGTASKGALVVVQGKRDKVNERVSGTYPTLGRVSFQSSQSAATAHAWQAGLAAGGRVALRPGVGAAGGRLQIGHSK